MPNQLSAWQAAMFILADQTADKRTAELLRLGAGAMGELERHLFLSLKREHQGRVIADIKRLAKRPTPQPPPPI